MMDKLIDVKFSSIAESDSWCYGGISIIIIIVIINIIITIINIQHSAS